jgi:cyclopropane-fatty-acyl-phospholipid synthase
MSLFPLDVVLKRLIQHGQLTIIDVDGKSQTFGKPGATPAVTIRLHDKNFLWRVAMNPSLYTGEGYMDGAWTLEQGTLREFLEVGMVSQDLAAANAAYGDALRRVRAVAKAGKSFNPLGKAQKNIEAHYDISHDLYELFLDKDMQYSCAYWREGTTTLDQAQLDKKRHIAKKLLLEPGMSVLDIGSGWGGMAIHLAREHGVKVTGLTLSTDQYETSVRRAQEAGLSDRVQFKLLDYRLDTNQYDRIVSVGMFEHVGKPHFREFFAHMKRLMKDDGVSLIHTIARSGAPGTTNEWILKYIFPGGYLPSLSELSPVIEKEGLWLTDLEILRIHYAKTLKEWDRNFQARRAEVAAKMGERFCRMWEFYLQGSEMSFRVGGLCNFQLQFAKKVGVVPLTRDYMYDDALVAQSRIAAE